MRFRSFLNIILIFYSLLSVVNAQTTIKETIKITQRNEPALFKGIKSNTTNSEISHTVRQYTLVYTVTGLSASCERRVRIWIPSSNVYPQSGLIFKEANIPFVGTTWSDTLVGLIQDDQPFDFNYGRVIAGAWRFNGEYFATQSYGLQKTSNGSYSATFSASPTTNPRICDNIAFRVDLSAIEHWGITSTVTVSPDTIGYGEETSISYLLSFAGEMDAETYFSNPDTDPYYDVSLDYKNREYGILVAPDGTTSNHLRDVTYPEISSGQVKFVANGGRPAELQKVQIQLNGGTTGSKEMIDLWVEADPDIFVSFDPNPVQPGDTASVVVKILEENGKLVDFPDKQLFEIGILEGSELGRVQISSFPDFIVPNPFIYYQPHKIIINEDVTDDSAFVKIRMGVPPEPDNNAASKILKNANNSINNANASEFRYGHYGIGYLKIRNNSLHHFKVTVDPDTIAHTDTTIITVQAKDAEGNNIDIPDTTHVDFVLNVNGELYGNLIAPDSSQSKRLLRISYSDAKAGKVKYIANGDVPLDWADPPVQVEGQLSNDAGVDGIATLQVQPLHYFEVSVAEDTIAYGDTVGIAVQPQNANNEDINMADTELIDFSLDANGEKYGHFLSPTGELKKSLNGVTFGEVQLGKVKFVANGENPCSPITFLLTASKSDDYEISGSDTTVVKCKMKFTHYTQGDSQWGDKDYDFYKKLDEDGEIVQPEVQYKISQKGCAMTCMAMVLKSAGLDYTAETLNEAMNENGYWGTHNKTGNWTGAVKWSAVSDFGSSEFKSKLILLGTHDDNWTPRKPISTEKLDSYLERCSYAIVLVGNQPDELPSQQSNHWVLVTNKKDGEYKILDPGGYDGRTTLAAYNDTIYRAIIYNRNCNDE